MNFLYDMHDKYCVILAYKKLQMIETGVMQLYAVANSGENIGESEERKIMNEFFSLYDGIRDLKRYIFRVRDTRVNRKIKSKAKPSKISIKQLCQNIDAEMLGYLSALSSVGIKDTRKNVSTYAEVKNVLRLMADYENREKFAESSDSNDLSMPRFVQRVGSTIDKYFQKNNLKRSLTVTAASCAAAAVFLTTPVEAPTFTESNGIEYEKENDVNEELARIQIRRNLLTEKRELLQAASLGMDISVLEDTSLRRIP